MGEWLSNSSPIHFREHGFGAIHTIGHDIDEVARLGRDPGGGSARDERPGRQKKRVSHLGFGGRELCLATTLHEERVRVTYLAKGERQPRRASLVGVCRNATSRSLACLYTHSSLLFTYADRTIYPGRTRDVCLEPTFLVYPPLPCRKQDLTFPFFFSIFFLHCYPPPSPSRGSTESTWHIRRSCISLPACTGIVAEQALRAARLGPWHAEPIRIHPNIVLFPGRRSSPFGKLAEAHGANGSLREVTEMDMISRDPARRQS